MAVRIQASWALANALDNFSYHVPALQPAVLLSLCQAVQQTLQDGDKVRCNGVRAAGNLLKQMPEQSGEDSVMGLLQLLIVVVAAAAAAGKQCLPVEMW